MEPSTTGQPSVSASPNTDAGETFFKTPGAPPGRHFKQTKVPSLVGPDFPIPASVSKLFRKVFHRTDTPTTRQPEASTPAHPAHFVLDHWSNMSDGAPSQQEVDRLPRRKANSALYEERCA